MSDTNGAPAEPEAKPASRIVIEFPGGAGTSQLNVTLEHVGSGQVYAAAWFLDHYAEQVRGDEILQGQRQAAITTPSAGALPPDVADIVQSILRGKPS